MDFTGIGMIERAEPMQDVDAMWESDAAAEWERLNESTDEETQYIHAFPAMSKAVRLLYEAESKLAEAIDEVRETAMEDRIDSILRDLEDLSCEVAKYRDAFERGERP